MDEENSVIVPVLTENLTVMSFVVPKDFADRVELYAWKLIDAFETHPAGSGMDPNNKMIQALSFLIQTSLEGYMDLCLENDDIIPPEISDL